MLREINVIDFAIIDRICVQFKPGFNVLSGETGSGKSILLKSLALLMGEKSVSGTIKTGATQAVVEGLFDIIHRPDIEARLVESGFDSSDHTLVVKRIISEDGKNRVYINGGLSTLQQLRDIVSPLIELSGYPAPLIEMTGQHDNRNLQNRTYHLETLDHYAGTIPLRTRVEEIFYSKLDVEKQILQLEEASRAKVQRLDFLNYQRDEIKLACLRPDDDIQIESELKILKDSHRLLEFVEHIETGLYSDEDSVLVRLHKFLSRGNEFNGHNKVLTDSLETLHQAKALIEEAVYQLRDFNKNLNTEPEHQERLEERLSQLRKLQKKYGQNVNDILSALQNIEEEIVALENSEEKIELLRSQWNTLNDNYAKESLKLHNKRLNTAPMLAQSVNKELLELNMKGLLFGVLIEKSSVPTAHGISVVEFTTQTSKKDVPRALAKFASGGELSRILLSLKSVVGLSGHPRTYLFDEVDAGVSGLTAEKVGRKLNSIAKNQQVICVTHLPQVAAFADVHFVIQKNQTAKGVIMTVEALNKNEKIQEIARMLSGEKITKSSLEHAKELLNVNPVI